MSAHANVSPLPWLVGNEIFVEDANLHTICVPYGYGDALDKSKLNAQTRANAAFIVRAVNNHERLVEALAKTVDWLASYPSGGATNVYDAARAALAAAKEGK